MRAVAPPGSSPGRSPSRPPGSSPEAVTAAGDLDWGRSRCRERAGELTAKGELIATTGGPRCALRAHTRGEGGRWFTAPKGDLDRGEEFHCPKAPSVVGMGGEVEKKKRNWEAVTGERGGRERKKMLE
jgi:hypothetical protein